MTSPLPSKISFTEERPWVQHAWDSSSLATYLRCPRRYFYQHVCGYTPRGESIDLVFGGIVHRALEEYHLVRPTSGHTEAQVQGLQALLRAAWRGVSSAETTSFQRGDDSGYWRSPSNNKNLWNACRAFVWHTEQFGLEPGIHTALIGRKHVAVELPFQFSLGIKPCGVPVTYCGHLDRIAEEGEARWVIDYKTTKKTISSEFFRGYQLSTQLPGYAVASQIVFHEPVLGVIVDGMQIGVDFVRCARGYILLGEEKADEWLENARGWINDAIFTAHSAPVENTETLGAFAQQNAKHWRMNTESCFICPFAEVCASTPSVRGPILDAAFTIKTWDPLERNKESK